MTQNLGGLILAPGARFYNCYYFYQLIWETLVYLEVDACS
jgi:hypothetical protein